MITPDAYPQILDSLPYLAIRFTYDGVNWIPSYVNKAVERYGYSREDFDNGKITWNDMLHPDDRVVALKLSRDYLAKGIDDFRLQYRIVVKNGESIYITEHAHVNRNPDGSAGTIDSFLFENLESGSFRDAGDDSVLRRNMALNDILLTLLDSDTGPEKAIQVILNRTGSYLDCSRALLFRDSPDHVTCKVEYEWLNDGISSIKDLDYAVTYSTEMPEIYVALQKTGILLVNAGEIPENCKEEFEAEGLVSSAIFAVYQHGDHYGFVCFDDCVIERKWDAETADFLKVVSNLLSNVVMRIQSDEYLREYENKIKSLAFRDFSTRLPNQYPFDSDMGDIIFAASAAGTPGHAVMITLNNVEVIRNTLGAKTANLVCEAVAVELDSIMRDTLGDTGTLYRIGGTVFAVLAQPGAIEPVRDFAGRVAARGVSRWEVAADSLECNLNVGAIPFGVKNTDPEVIKDLLDKATIESCVPGKGNPVVRETEV